MSAVEPIAIIGIGCRFPGGVKSADDLWKLLADGVDAVVEVPDDRWNLSAVYHPDPAKPGRMITRWGGFLDQIDRFDAQFFGIKPARGRARRPPAATDARGRVPGRRGRRPDAWPRWPGDAGGVYVGISHLGLQFPADASRRNAASSMRTPISALRFASRPTASPISSISSVRASPSTPPARRRSWPRTWPAAASGTERASWPSSAASI